MCQDSAYIYTNAGDGLAGHPTLGATYVILQEGLVPGGDLCFSVQEKIGPIGIRVEGYDPLLLWLETPPIKFETVFDGSLCAKILRLKEDDLLDVKPQIANAGNPTLLVAVRDKEAVDRAAIDVELFSTLRYLPDTPFCLFVFTPTDKGAYSRMFAPSYGIAEDPATGSSTGPLGAFMKHHKLLPNDGLGRFVSEQGTRMGRRSLLYFEIKQTENGDRISVGGHVTPLVDAVMTLQF